MIIAFSIIALMIISGLAIGMYAIFIPFLSNISDIQSYNIAYYGAIASVERALLVARVQEFGYDNTGGWNNLEVVGQNASDHNPENLGRISEEQNGMRWVLQGTTNRIPQAGKSNIPTLFTTTNNNNYNAGYYNNTLTIQPEIRDNNSSNSYIQANKIPYQGEYIQTHRRIPIKIGGEICTQCEQDEIIILRQRRGVIDGEDFNIIPHEDFDTNTNFLGQEDTNIRKSTINNTVPPANIPILSFANNINPLTNNTTIIDTHNGFGPGFDAIQGQTFRQIRTNPQTENVVLVYDIVQKASQANGFIYPFLEYYIESEQSISNTYRDITGHGKINPYHVQVQIKKPQKNQQKGGSFSIIF